MNEKTTAEDILKKYSSKIESQIETKKSEGDYSREYLEFKSEMLPEQTRYEKLFSTIGNIINIKPSQKDAEKISKQLQIAHVDATPSQVITFSILAFLAIFFIGLLVFVLIYIFTGTFQMLFLFLVLLVSLFIFYYFYQVPRRMANKWRLQASSQMVPCILYIVVYMRHTSNLEQAIRFASEHLQPPLALDLKKVFWDVQVAKYSSIKESLDSYLENWRDYSIEFIEAFHLIESSLYEPSEQRRIIILEKSLTVILDGVYEKMLKYTHEVKSPLTNLYMLGIVLPTLGLALLPLASTLLQGMIKSYHVFVLFNLIIPFFVFYMTSEIMMKRPGGYGETEMLELNPLYPKYKSKKPYLIAFLIVLPLIILGFLPLIFQYSGIPDIFGLQKDYSFANLGISFMQGDLFGFKSSDEGIIGPFGVLAVILSLLIPLSAALFFSLAYKMKTKELIVARNESKNLEKEFASSLFQLGNRLGDGVPAELAFPKMIEATRGTVTENFFKTVNVNIQEQGMSLENAIFNKKRGAIVFYPSTLIATSMRILVEAVKKGLSVAAMSLMSISDYVKNIDKINERLHDLLAEIISDMKSNMTFLAPLLAGIVVGLAAMITTILARLKDLFSLGLADQSVAGLGNIGTITQIFDITKMISPYYLQISIGIYLVEIIFILTSTLVTIDSGTDKLKEKNEIGRNLRTGILLYFIVSLIAVVALSVLAGVAVGGLGG